MLWCADTCPHSYRSRFEHDFAIGDQILDELTREAVCQLVNLRVGKVVVAIADPLIELPQLFPRLFAECLLFEFTLVSNCSMEQHSSSRAMTSWIWSGSRSVSDEGQGIVTCRRYNPGVHVLLRTKDSTGLSGQLLPVKPFR